MRKWISIKSYKEINETKKNANTFSSNLMLYSALRNIYSVPRCLIVVTKKRISKKAVVRNRVKRRIKAALDKINLENLDMVLVPNILCLNISFNALVTEIENLHLLSVKKLKIN